MISQARRRAAAAKPAGFALAVPDALAVDPDQPPRFLTNPQRWNDGSAWPGKPSFRGFDDSGFLAAVGDEFRFALLLDHVDKWAELGACEVMLETLKNVTGL